MPRIRAAAVVAALWLAPIPVVAVAGPPANATVVLRGHPQSLRLLGPGTGPPVVLSSGDGGWVHLAPHVAEVLANHGYFVVGFDTKAYLESFTSGGRTLRDADEPRDYRVLAAFAARATGAKPVLIGVSEGAGLSVLAATDPGTRDVIAGVVGLGLPDINELGWRWKDAIIYVTHGTPDEPTFSTKTLVPRLAPLPLAAIHSTHDEFVPVPEIQAIMALAREPKRLWVVPAANHRFSDNLPGLDAAVLEALAWLRRPK